MPFTPVMNDEPVLASAIVNGHQLRALLDTGSVTSFIKHAFVALGRLGYIRVTIINACMGITHDIQCRKSCLMLMVKFSYSESEFLKMYLMTCF